MRGIAAIHVLTTIASCGEREKISIRMSNPLGTDMAFFDTYWWIGEPNLGDAITPFLLEHFGHKPNWVVEKKAQLIMSGSMLDWMPDEYSGLIFGSGLMTSKRRRFPNAKFLSIRGPWSRDLVAAGDTILGDPALLADVLVDKVEPEFPLGFIPHFADKSKPEVIEYAERHKDIVLTIDVQKDVLEILRDVVRCENIVSSSLHGLVVADAFEIPAAWLWSPDVAGNGFKFFDYHKGIGIERDHQKLREPHKLIEVANKANTRWNKEQLLDLMNNLDDYV